MAGKLQALESLAQSVWEEIAAQIREVETIVRANTIRVLDAFRAAGIADHGFGGTTGYGYDDYGREALDAAFASIFCADAALVRWQIVSGTHAIALALFGVLRPGDLLVSAVGKPYETLDKVIGGRDRAPASLADFGVRYAEAPLSGEKYDLAAIESLSRSARMVLVQRSRGYSWRASLTDHDIRTIVQCVKSANPDAVVLVDNCYGEFTRQEEPPSWGADLVAGSLIKNPGGSISPTGGYVAGRAELVEMSASRLTAPGLGSHVGPTLGITRLMAQGLYLAPMIVGEALTGSIFASRLFERLGLEVSPRYCDERDDIVLGIKFGSRQRLLEFMQAVQTCSPVNSMVRPEPAPMPGYADQVVMAAGTFVQGSSIELSADGPLREPFIGYLQGGVTRYQVEYAALNAALRLGLKG